MRIPLATHGRKNESRNLVTVFVLARETALHASSLCGVARVKRHEGGYLNLLVASASGISTLLYGNAWAR
jgi:hypothetical protein